MIRQLNSVALVLLMGGTLSFAQDRLDLAGPPAGSWDNGTKVRTDILVTFTIHMANTTSVIQGGTWGFEVCLSQSPDGVPDLGLGSYGALVSINLVAFNENPYPYFDGGYWTNYFSNDGLGADTVGYGGLAIGKAGIPIGFNRDINTIRIGHSLGDSLVGSYLCIDTAFWPPMGQWLWSTESGDIHPSWDGPHCYLIEDPLPPVIS